MAAPRKPKAKPVQDGPEAAETVEALPVPAGHVALFHDTASSCSTSGGVHGANEDGSFHVPAEHVAALIESHGFKVEG